MAKRKRRKKAKFGDIFEVQTSKGLVYVQYTHYHPFLIDVMRILPGFYQERPKNFRELVQQKEREILCYDIDDLTECFGATIVAHEDVPAHLQPFPLFRHQIPYFIEKEGKKELVEVWVLWDGENFFCAGDMSPEKFWELPHSGVIISDQYMRDLLEGNRTGKDKVYNGLVLVKPEVIEDWTPKREERIERETKEGMPLKGEVMQVMQEGLTRQEADRMVMEVAEMSGADLSQPTLVRHYLYFPKKRQAKAAAKELMEKGYQVVVDRAAVGDDFLVLAEREAVLEDEDMVAIGDEMEEIAGRYGGEYDGWEMALRKPEKKEG